MSARRPVNIVTNVSIHVTRSVTRPGIASSPNQKLNQDSITTSEEGANVWIRWWPICRSNLKFTVRREKLPINVYKCINNINPSTINSINITMFLGHITISFVQLQRPNVVLQQLQVRIDRDAIVGPLKSYFLIIVRNWNQTYIDIQYDQQSQNQSKINNNKACSHPAAKTDWWWWWYIILWKCSKIDWFVCECVCVIYLLTTFDINRADLNVHRVQLELHLAGNDRVHASCIPNGLVFVESHRRKTMR